MLAALHEAAALHQGKISQISFTRLRRSHPEWPSVGTYDARGGWNSWLKAAGLPITPSLPKKGRWRYSDGQCHEAAERVWRKLGGRVYSRAEYNAHRRPSDPAGQTLELRFGQRRWVPALMHLLPQLFEDPPHLKSRI